MPKLYKEFCDSGDREVADELVQSLDNARKQRWLKTVENMNFTHSSRKAWSEIRRLGAANAKLGGKSETTANKVAARLVNLTKVNMNKRRMSKVKNKLKCKRKTLSHNQEYSHAFTIDEITEAISFMKVGKAAGMDNVHPEFIRNCGPKAIEWLRCFFNDILKMKNVPTVFKKTKIIAVLKPGKKSNSAENFRPISLLSITYKLLERLLYKRISPEIHKKYQ